MSRLDEVIRDINKKAKTDILTRGLPEIPHKKIPFTSPRMNYCTFGGIPIGFITEFYGEEHGGKTTTALDIVANYQRSDDERPVLYIDAENTLDVEWARKLGVLTEPEKFILLQPEHQSAEEIFQMIYEIVGTGEVGLWVLDSIAVLVSSQAWDKDLTEKTYAGISASLSAFASKMVQLNHKYTCTGVGINQLRDNFNSMYGGTKTPGGRQWKHCCAVRMEFKRGDFIDDKGKKLTRSAENPAGNIVLMSMTKNKFCPASRRTGFYTINYNTGINYLYDLVEVALKYDIVRQSGAWFAIMDPETGEIIKDKIHGQSAVYEVLEQDEECLAKVETLTEKFMQEN